MAGPLRLPRLLGGALVLVVLIGITVVVVRSAIFYPTVRPNGVQKYLLRSLGFGTEDVYAEMTHSKVIIVGAGPAGIAAASRLLEDGFTDVILLEAENRIGGRVHTTSFGESNVDVGAQWCHGEKENVVYAMAEPLGLLASSLQVLTDLRLVNSQGTFMQKEMSDWLTVVTMETVDKAGEQTSFGVSLGEFIDKEFYARIRNPDAPYKIDDALAEQYLKCFRLFQCSIDGSDSCYDTSVSSSNQYWECEGNPVLNWKTRGYGTVLDLLTKNYPDPSKRLKVQERVQLGKEVETINWRQDSQSPRIRVTCADGSAYTADQLIVTVSLGVLKHNVDRMFQPSLPSSKLNAIAGLSIGTSDKIFLKFSHSWWPQDVSAIGLLWTAEDESEFLKANGKNEKRRWLPGIFEFFVDHSQPGVLCGWVIGSSAHDMERCSDDEVKEGCQEILEKFLGRTYSIPPIEAVLRSTWYSNPHFRGSYSFRSLSTDKLGANASQLAEPIYDSAGKEVILFAGEATHDHYFSTVHGAVESGWREANRILKNSREMEETRLIINPSIPIKTCQVLILGAGMAGLGAAVTLKAGGFKDFIILEAQDEAGGRVKSISHNGDWLELGAQWIHGEDNALFRLAKERGLLSDQCSVEGLGPHVYEDGTEVDSSLTAHVAHVVSQILEECEDFVQSSTYPKSVGHFLRQRFSQYLDSCATDTQDQRKMKEDLFDWHIRFQKIDNSCTNLNKLSAKDWGKYAFTGGQDCINLSKGYGAIVDAVVESLPPELLEYGKQVVQVEWMPDLDENSPPVLVSCADGSQYSAKHVIITMSLGCLKKNAYKLFKPRLPHRLMTTINALGFGVVDKVFLMYDEPWWSPDTFGFQIIRSSQQDSRNSDQKEESDPTWLDDLTGFDVLVTRPGVLLAWLGGEGASDMEKMKKDDIAQQFTDLLRKSLRRPDIPLPADVVRSTWHSNPFVCGGYSHTTTECDKLGVGPEDLMKPVFSHTPSHIKHPTILFAGEAAHSSHFSTTHGAFETGQRQAKHVLEYSRESKSNNKDALKAALLSTSETGQSSPVKVISATVVS